MFCDAQIDLLPLSYSVSNLLSSPARDFPFFPNGGGCYRAGPNYYTRREKLDSYLLLFTTGGEGMLSYRGKTQSLSSGTGALIHCWEFHEYKTARSGYWEFYWMHFSGGSVPVYMDMLGKDSPIALCADPDKEAILRIFEAIFSHMQSALASNQAVLSDQVSQLLTRLVCAHALFESAPLKQKYRQELESVTQYIQSHYCEEISIDSVVSRTYLSKYHFLRIFKEYTGQSMYDYILHLRINHAKSLLKRSDTPVHQISSMVGFRDPTTFIRCFKKIVRTTPLQYRKYFID